MYKEKLFVLYQLLLDLFNNIWKESAHQSICVLVSRMTHFTCANLSLPWMLPIVLG